MARIMTYFLFILSSKAQNEPVEDSQLGIFSNSCAESFCANKDGLELWLSLSKKSDVVIEPELWTPFQVANICAMISLSGFVFGIMIEKMMEEL
jgi:hypothetical protein